jgi:hypothetical protein
VESPRAERERAHRGPPLGDLGRGGPPERAASDDVDPLPGDPGSDLAWEIAAEHDPDWAAPRDDDAFVQVWEADENDVEILVEQDPRVRGYAPYLIDPRRGPTAR